MDWLSKRMESQTVAEIAETYGFLLEGKDLARTRRFERAAMPALEKFVAGAEQMMAPEHKVSGERRKSLEKLSEQANELRQKIRAERAKRRPRSIAHGEAVVARLESAWKAIAGSDYRPNSTAVSKGELRANEYAGLAKARAAKDWTAMEKFYERFLSRTTK